MKIFTVIFCHLLALHATAFKLTLIPKDSTHQFGMGIVTPERPAKVTLIFLHGIGERGDGSVKALKKFTSWGGINLKNDPQSIFAAADHFGINIICIQTAHNFEYGEIPYAVRFAIDSLHSDSRQIHLLRPAGRHKPCLPGSVTVFASLVLPFLHANYENVL